MNSDGCVELGFGGPCFHGDGEPLNDLRAPWPAMWQPTTRSSEASTTSFTIVCSLRLLSVSFSGVKTDL